MTDDDLAAGAAAGSAGRVVVVGDVMTDVVVRPEGPLRRGSDRRAAIRLLPGGSGANQACWLAHFGASVRLAARVGASDRDRLAADLAGAGVEARLAADPDRPTGLLVALIDPDGERSFLTDRGANDGLCAGDVAEDLLDGVVLVHLSGYALVAPGPRAAVLGFARRARARGAAVSIDPASTGFLAEIGPENFLAWTEGADFLFPNAEEAALLAGSPDPVEQGAVLGARYGTVVVKRGASGAEAHVHGRRHICPAPAAAALDATGAGDAFLGAYLAAHLSGFDTARCLERAIAAGTAITAVVGARPQALREGRG